LLETACVLGLGTLALERSSRRAGDRRFDFTGAFRMKTYLLRFMTETEGQDLIEYALLAALVALGAVAGMTALAGGINQKFTDVSSSLGSAS
jgi:pilus assembly protein Flp/PilA